MFSCFFLDRDGKTITPDKCDLNYLSLGKKCSGTACLTLTTPRGHTLHDIVLYVPSLIYNSAKGPDHCYGGRCTVRLTGCKIKKDDSQLAEQVSLVEWERNRSSKSCPVSYTNIWNRMSQVVLQYGCAQSSEDTILFLGNVNEAINIQLSFIIDIILADCGKDIRWYYMAMLPSRQTFMKVSMELPPANIEHLDVVKISPTAASFTYRISTERLLAEVYCSNESSPSGIQVSMTLARPLIGHSHTVLFTNNLPINELHSCDGVQLIDYYFSSDKAANSSSDICCNREYIFMVDCSGSMCDKILSVSQSLLLAIKGLSAGCHFNIIAFGSKYRMPFQSSMDAGNAKSHEQGIQFTKQLRACLGGTELLTPIKWIFRSPLPKGFMRHCFLITDGGVPNVSMVLQTVTKNSYNTKFHTFALGPEICCELLGGLSAVTNGTYTVINETDRLQTKVMEVLSISLIPSLQNVSIIPIPPQGYTLIEPNAVQLTTSSSRLSQDSQFVLLKKQSSDDRVESSPTLSQTTTITGSYLNETIHCEIPSSTLIDSSSDHCVTLLQSVAWSRMDTLKEKLSSYSSRHRSNNSNEGMAPSTKVSCHRNGVNFESVREEIINISKQSRVSYHRYTQFCSPNEEGGVYYQLTPWNSRHLAKVKKESIATINIPVRKRPRSTREVVPPSERTPYSLTSLVGTVARAAVNLVTLGYFDGNGGEEETVSGHRIEDQEYYSNTANRIHWDKNHQLVLPDFYYTNIPTSSSSSSSYYPSSSSTDTPTNDSSGTTTTSLLSTTISSDEYITTDTLTTTTNAAITGSSDSSDTSLQVSLPPPVYASEEEPLPFVTPEHFHGDRQSYYMPLIEMQLVSGAWPLEHPISVITGVSMDVIMGLPVISTSSSTPSDCTWTTALAVAFLIVHCGTYRKEWQPLVNKTQSWFKSQGIIIKNIYDSDIIRTAIKLIENHT